MLKHVGASLSCYTVFQVCCPIQTSTCVRNHKKMAAQETHSNNVSTVVIGSRCVMITPLATQTQAPSRSPVITQTQSVTQTVICVYIILNRTADLKISVKAHALCR